MIDRIADLQGRVQRSRDALQGLADQAAELRVRVAALPVGGGTAPGGSGQGGAGQGEGERGEQEAGAGPGGALASSLDRLSHAAILIDDEGSAADDGRFLSDAWEIALINEEGK